MSNAKRMDGDWVEFSPLGSAERLTGFIVDFPSIAIRTQVCKVHVPALNTTYTVEVDQTTRVPSDLRLSDIPSLIDISLDSHDEKWFTQLVEYTPKPPVDMDMRFLLVFLPLLSLFLVCL